MPMGAAVSFLDGPQVDGPNVSPQSSTAPFQIDIHHFFFELFETVFHDGRVGKFVQSVAPSVGDVLAVDDAAVGGIYWQRVETDFFGELKGSRLRLQKGGAGGVHAAVVFHD